MRSVHEAFSVYLQWKTPSATQRQVASLHRASVERSIGNRLEVILFRETGSFRHGTGVANYSDVDLLVSLKGTRPESSDTALRWIREALVASFPRTNVRVSRPAVVVPFANRNETFEVIPGFVETTAPHSRYRIPAPGGNWMSSTPEAHLTYVNDAPEGAKRLARLLKAWKYHNSVPVSSFYLEMRAAQHMYANKPFSAPVDLCWVLESLSKSGLAGMQDPTGSTGLIKATSSLTASIDATSKVRTAATRARNALTAYQSDRLDDAFRYYDLLFGGTFPSRYA